MAHPSFHNKVIILKGFMESILLAGLSLSFQLPLHLHKYYLHNYYMDIFLFIAGRITNENHASFYAFS